jgi:hypothetical protein
VIWSLEKKIVKYSSEKLPGVLQNELGVTGMAGAPNAHYRSRSPMIECSDMRHPRNLTAFKNWIGSPAVYFKMTFLSCQQ